ncbi:hypothetical protein [Flavobacterium aquicola]|uniref:Uncharacterized protein n=1 Tax=Flavobacterium aquicola TaxID=1682742 RepID=A0A3E0ERT4_9FLAO|nr:hypothetical protein [Flavobacterium aquicola]REH00902.1 hypothetical protein C8P67_102154 [Flavobacterium aquicola]
MKKLLVFIFIAIGLLTNCSNDNDSKEKNITDKSFDYKIIDAKGYDSKSNQTDLPFTIDKDSRFTYNKEKQTIELTVYKDNAVVPSIFFVTSFEKNIYHTKAESDNDFSYDFELADGKIINYIYSQKVLIGKVIYIVQ